jgi:hypothetical protein
MSAYIDLRNALADAYNDADKQRDVVEVSGLNTGDINMSGASRTVWGNILREVKRRGLLNELRSAVESDGRQYLGNLFDAHDAELNQKAQQDLIDRAHENNWLDPELTPKTIDRTSPTNRLIFLSTENMRRCMRNPAGQHAHEALVLIGRSDDGIDALVQRFVKREALKCWSHIADQVGGFGKWVEKKEWKTAKIETPVPDNFSKDGFAVDLKMATTNALRAKPLNNRFANAAGFAPTIVTRITSAEQCKTITSTWIGIWEELLQGSMSQPVFPVLCLVQKEKEASVWTKVFGSFGREKADDNFYTQAKDKVVAARKATPPSRMELHIADQLRILDDEDFGKWHTEEHLHMFLSGDELNELEDLRVELFGENKSQRVRKKKFVDKILHSQILLKAQSTVGGNDVQH